MIKKALSIVIRVVLNILLFTLLLLAWIIFKVYIVSSNIAFITENIYVVVTIATYLFIFFIMGLTNVFFSNNLTKGSILPTTTIFVLLAINTIYRILITDNEFIYFSFGGLFIDIFGLFLLFATGYIGIRIKAKLRKAKSA